MIIDARKMVGVRHGREGTLKGAVDAALDSIGVGQMVIVEGAVNAFGEEIPWQRVRPIINKSLIGHFKTRKSPHGIGYEVHRVA